MNLFFFQSHLLKPENSDPSFNFDFRGEIPMKGKPRPIQMWILSRKTIGENDSTKKQLDFEKLTISTQCPFTEFTKNYSNNKI